MMKYPARLLPLLLLACPLLAEQPLYLNPDAPLEARVKDLRSRMTLEEKAAQMVNESPGVPRLGVPRYEWWSEALHGVARAGHATVFPQAIGIAATWDPGFLRQEGHTIGIEARAKFNHAKEDGHAGQRFYGLTFWSPNINIFRDPRWGRGQETYGEDPFLTARMGVAFVEGMQGDDPHYLLAAACAKHFAVHSGPEPLRHHFYADPPEADFHDTYLPAFEALVREAHVEAVMMSYNAVYGEPSSISSRLYGLLYNQWGFDGHVTSDCGSINDLVDHYRRASDLAEAEALSLNAGLCVRCVGGPTQLVDAVHRGLITEDELDKRLDQLLRTQFRLGFYDPPERVPFNNIPFSDNDSPAHAAQALTAARESMVLLKNDGVLPLDRSKVARVAVIGPNADSVNVLLGNYHGDPSAPVTILAGLKQALGEDKVTFAAGCDLVATPAGLHPIPRRDFGVDRREGLMLEGFSRPGFEGETVLSRRMGPLQFDLDRPRGASMRVRGAIEIPRDGTYTLRYDATGGYRLRLAGKIVADNWDTTGDSTWTETRDCRRGETLDIFIEYNTSGGRLAGNLQWQMPSAAAEVDRAIAAAKQADVVVFVGGISAGLEGEDMPVDIEGFEGGDRTLIELPKVQRDLIAKLKTTGKPLVFVLMSGSAVALPGVNDQADAIVEAWYPGQAGGTAVADVLLGKVSPAGRLPVTFYSSTADLPPFDDYSMTGRTYRYFKGPVLYPFGHGLSYTTFEYSGMQAQVDGDVVHATVNVRNSGACESDEVVQLYAAQPAGAHARERIALCGFRRIHLEAGESQVVAIDVPRTVLRRWDDYRNAYEVPAGTWTLSAGASSGDLRQSVPVKLR